MENLQSEEDFVTYRNSDIAYEMSLGQKDKDLKD